nr:Sir2 family NAD-dependent protein deacetylase [Candidatus Sigynarchaeota archaeon]
MSIDSNVPMLPLDDRISLLARWISGSKHLVIMTGAGISTESGVPDFRGPDGVWTRRDKGLPPPEMKKSLDDVEPNAGHVVLVELQDMGFLKFVISQNVDNLHLRSGIRPDMISELHGNYTFMQCLECEKRVPKAGFWDEAKWGPGYTQMEVRAGQPVCPECGGRIVSSIINFNDYIFPSVMKPAIKHSQLADLFIVVGSSLAVYPANDLPIRAKKYNKGRIVIINRQETSLDKACDLRFTEDAGMILTRVLQKIKLEVLTNFKDFTHESVD